MSPGDRVRQGRADVALRELLFPRAFAVEDIAEALHEDVAVGEHVGQLADLLRVGNRLIERDGEIVAAQHGNVGVVALEILVAVAVDDTARSLS